MEKKKQMQAIKDHFNNEAEEYDNNIRDYVPKYDEMTDALVAVLCFLKKGKIKVIDLGCGTGNISVKIKERFPRHLLHAGIWLIICRDWQKRNFENIIT